MWYYIVRVRDQNQTIGFKAFQTAREAYYWGRSHLSAIEFLISCEREGNNPIGKWVREIDGRPNIFAVWRLVPYDDYPRR